MALVLVDRVQQTGTANTTVSFTLSGSVTGFQSFSVIGNTNTTYYAATDASGNWEVGVGTYATAGPTLTRTTILSSSNSGSAVTFSGTVNVFVTYPSERSVYSDGTNIIPDNAAVLLPTSGGTGQSTYTNGQLLIGNTTGNTLTKATLTQGSGISITNGTGSISIATAAPDVQTFNASGTWTKPGSGNFVRIQMWGGGGGGSRSSANQLQIGAGGGGGYVELIVPIAEMGATATVTVGAAGVGRTGSAGVGTDGGNSAVTLGSGSIVYVSGGLGAVNDGAGGAGGLGEITFTTAAVAGSNGATSSIPAGNGYSYGGGGGGTATNSAGGKGGYGGGGGTRSTGAGGTSIFGGAGGNSTTDGTQPGGGGGSGNTTNTNATNGGLGRVIITTY